MLKAESVLTVKYTVMYLQSLLLPNIILIPTFPCPYFPCSYPSILLMITISKPVLLIKFNKYLLSLHCPKKSTYNGNKILDTNYERRVSPNTSQRKYQPCVLFPQTNSTHKISCLSLCPSQVYLNYETLTWRETLEGMRGRVLSVKNVQISHIEKRKQIQREVLHNFIFSTPTL